MSLRLAAFASILLMARSSSAASEACVSPSADAVRRMLAMHGVSPYELRQTLRFDALGDLDGDGCADVSIAFGVACGSAVGCVPNFLYLRRPGCAMFVGAVDGELVRVLAASSHGLHDLVFVLPGVFTETETRLSFDGLRYRPVAERSRPGRQAERGPWSKWARARRTGDEGG